MQIIKKLRHKWLPAMSVPKGDGSAVLKGRLARSATMVLLAVALGGCVAERHDDLETDEGRQAAFTLTVPGLRSPSTRALNAAKEQEVSEIDVVIFRNSDNILVEYRRVDAANIVPTANGWQFKVTEIDNNTDITAAVITNASLEVSDALAAVSVGGSYAGAAKADFLAALQMANGTKWNTSAVGYWRIPMYGEMSVTGSIYSGTLPEVQLTRMLAKVDVVNNVAPTSVASPGDFTLTAVHVVNYNTLGRIAPAWNAQGVIQSGATTPNLPADPGTRTWAEGNELTYTTSSTTAPILDEIYLFESTALSANPSSPTGLRLVLEGDYTSDEGTEHYYYPVDFTSPTGSYIPVLRNNRYLFTITEAAGRGYDSLGEAVAAQGVMSNLRTSVLTVDDSGIHNTVWNGEYFLGLEKKEVFLSKLAGYTVNVKCITNYAAGWTIDWSKGANDGIEYTGGTTGWLSVDAVTWGDPGSDIKLKALSINSGEANRTAIVHLKAGRLTHTLKVTQYNSIAQQFARSNIIWDGSKLTFAVTEADNAAIPSDVQGVFFRWGSLVAISPVGANYTSSQLLFRASDTTNYTWANIPYTDETEVPFDDIDFDTDDFATYNGGTGYNASTNKGDICRYISDKGWVEGQWRLPTAGEQDALKNEASVSNAKGFTEIVQGTPSGSNGYGNHANGYYQPASGRWLGKGAASTITRGTEAVPGSYSVYFPTSGYRLRDDGSISSTGSAGLLWSGSSANTLYAFYMSVNSSNAFLNYMNRTYGYSVRCIRK